MLERRCRDTRLIVVVFGIECGLGFGIRFEFGFGFGINWLVRVLV